MKQKALNLRFDRHPLAKTLTFHISEIQNIAKKDGSVDDDRVVQYLKSAIKKLDADEYSDPDEKKLLDIFLPQMVALSEVKAFIDGLEDKSMGAVMKAVKVKWGSLVNMKEVSKLI